MTTLLVASAGGHLAELVMLVDRLRPPVRDRTWVTYDRPDAYALLEGEEVVGGHGPSTRHLGNALRNARLAWRLLRSGRFDRVISTGAGISVPFLGVARALGIESHYIELSTRVIRPSLSGRLLEFVPGVHLYTQSSAAATPPWNYSGSVFDGFEPEPVDAPGRPLRLFVALGTHRFRFDRLVHQVVRAAIDGDEIIWQLGATWIDGLPGEAHVLLSPQEVADTLAASDVVICHAGVGLAEMALRAGRLPVLVPRRAERKEHVDDHQVELAEHLASRGLAIHVEVTDLGRGDVEQAARTRVTYETPGPFRLQG